MAGSLRATLTLSLLAAAAVPAHAERGVDVEVRGDAIVARVHDAPHAGRGHAMIRDEDGDYAYASAATPFAEGDQRLAIVFVVQGTEIWMGNDHIVLADDPSCMAGALEGVEQMIDYLDFAHTMPRGSEGAVVTYARGASVRLGLRPLAQITGAALGSQKDYYSAIGGSDLVMGVKAAFEEVQRSTAPHKVIVILGDGNDTNNDAARVQLAELRRDAERAHVAVDALIWKGMLSDRGDVVSDVARTTIAVDDSTTFGIDVAELLGRETDEQTFTFANASELPWDGKSHALTVTVDGESFAPVHVQLPKLAAADGCALPSAWWFQLGGGLLAVAGLAGLTKLRSRAAQT